MSYAFDLLQQALLSGNDYTAHARLRSYLDETFGQLDPVTRARAQMLLRLSHAAEHFDNPTASQRTGIADLLVLMRQVIRTFGSRLEIPIEWWKKLQAHTPIANLFPGERGDSKVSLHASAWNPMWLSNFDPLEAEGLTYRRTQHKVLGDGMLAKYSAGRITTYRSEGQKVALDAVLHAPPGASLLVTLPTGGGKSMCILLPAWLASEGGQRIGGTTIVVVPTVSLAIDQHAHVSENFATYRPYTLLGDTEGTVRAEIYQGICDGTLPILYTSPEALINNSRLRESVLDAASRGSLNWLVIDEAHMVEQWGAGFRTEFQLLAALRQQLMIRTHNKLRTLLLSATVSGTCKQTLTELFGDGRELSTVAANQLRPEISYWLAIAENQTQRKEYFRDALLHLPRPAILYVTLPEEADEWITYLGHHGFKRMASYTGKTSALKRAQIMSAWTRNEIDLMVATSAFGLGVDKEDVRAVLHATLPENIDRFYQEVGRGGRDGCQSISLMCTVPEEDSRLAKSMSIRSRITVDKAWQRWSAMWSKRRRVDGSDAHYLIDLEAPPANRPEMEPTDTHRNWNEHILLLMQRANLLQIRDANPTENQDVNGDSSGVPFQRRWLHVALVNARVTYSQEDFSELFEPHRQEEIENIIAAQKQMQDLAITYARYKSGQARVPCISNKFKEVYCDAASACGGCPVCRSQNYQPSSLPVHVEYELEMHQCLDAPLDLNYSVHQLFTSQAHLHVVWDETEYPRRPIAHLLSRLLEAGFGQFVLPAALLQADDWVNGLVNSFAHVALMPRHRLLSDDMLLGNTYARWSLYPWPTVIVYPTEPTRADRLYRQVKALGTRQPLVQIIPGQLYLPSEYGRFLERVDGLRWGLQQFAEQLQERLETL